VSGREIGWDFIRSAYASVARLAIISLPDLMSLGSEARLNTPGVGQGNWTWRYRAEQLTRLAAQSAPYLRELGELHGRLPAVSPASATR
jgi:4-alpha-glucanotransferase